MQTNGSTTALERARTNLEVAFPNQQQTPVTFGEIDTSSRRTITEVQQIANAVIVASLVIAGCSLAVSVTAGISDRKRPLSLLRLAGAPCACYGGWWSWKQPSRCWSSPCSRQASASWPQSCS